MITSTPIPRSNEAKNSIVDETTPLNNKNFTSYDTPSGARSPRRYNSVDDEESDLDTRREHIAQCFGKSSVNLSSLARRKNALNLRQSPIIRETILPDVSSDSDRTRSFCKDCGTNTEKSSPKTLERSDFRFEEILPHSVDEKREVRTRNFGTETKLNMRDVQTPDDVALIVEDALRIYRDSMTKTTSTRGTQYVEEAPRVPQTRDQQIQVSEPFKMRTNVGVNVKPRTAEIGTEVGPRPGTRSIAIGPDPVSTQPISLNSMNSRSHSFNYGDTKPKRKTTKTVGVLTEGLVKTTARGTDTSGLAPKKREFGTSPMKKIFVDVSVGDSLKPHIAISCAANYCDNCKETIKNLARQMSNSSDVGCNKENSNVVSRIPRPSHIGLSTPDSRRVFKRQDTYTKIPASGVIRYDADNRDQYETNNR